MIYNLNCFIHYFLEFRIYIFEYIYISGIATSVTKANSDEEDVDVIVDGDDTQIYGSAQYSDKDLQHMDEATEKPSDELSDTKTKDNQHNLENGWPSELSPYPVLEALKSRIRELECRDQNKELYKCLICMGVYKTPVVSVCCWHVHCEQCWLKTLATKKLCPQCNMITNMLDLRRIYI